jgi:leucyl-tRNA---protein transferase
VSERVAPPLVLHRTLPAPCPYLQGRIEQRLVVTLEGIAVDTFDKLSRTGFRRSHTFAYRPTCPSCTACVPIRVPAERFAPGRTQRRIARRNADLFGSERRADATREHYALFKAYVAHRHSDGDMAQMSFGDFRSMVEDAIESTRLIEYRTAEGTLVAAVLADRLADGISAVYSFFDPDLETRSLGTFMVLDLVERMRQERLPFVYLGYWIADSRKMAYKTNYRPAEIMVDGAWRPLAAAPAEEIRE